MKNTVAKWIAVGVIPVLLMIGTVFLFRKDLDVVGKESVASFGKVLAASKTNAAADDINGGWSLAAPDGSVRFIWSKDHSKSPMGDLMLETDAQPFLDAGLDTVKLPERFAFYDGKLMVGTKLGNDELKYSAEATPLASYQLLVNKYRDSIGYHAAPDHFNVAVGNGNIFEWAKDMSTNDKDIMFVLDPAPFIAAGTDPVAVEGWVFAKVQAHVNGKATEVDRLLKFFDLE